eukprot:TRINITY_DN19720_c0_g1_i5.p2 TRINITY_DN19720_c0_g1~~TRINITY_DN19720_c0_g1_i5.p2  ORF type:complete len:120 (-),score=8.39 TRINITY_DN19720_c0_g1_i5:121-480(-)
MTTTKLLTVFKNSVSVALKAVGTGGGGGGEGGAGASGRGSEVPKSIPLLVVIQDRKQLTRAYPPLPWQHPLLSESRTRTKDAIPTCTGRVPCKYTKGPPESPQQALLITGNVSVQSWST